MIPLGWALAAIGLTLAALRVWAGLSLMNRMPTSAALGWMPAAIVVSIFAQAIAGVLVAVVVVLAAYGELDDWRLPLILGLAAMLIVSIPGILARLRSRHRPILARWIRGETQGT